MDGDGGLLPVLVGLRCSSVTMVHGESAFLAAFIITES